MTDPNTDSPIHRSRNTDPSYNEFAEQLNISPGYLRKIARKLNILGYTDPLKRSRKLLDERDRNLIQDHLGKRRSTDLPIQNTDPDIERNTAPVIHAELVLLESEPQRLDYSLGLAAQTAIDTQTIAAHIDNQLDTFTANFDAFCSSLEEAMVQKIARTGANAMSRGIAAMNSQVPAMGGKP